LLTKKEVVAHVAERSDAEPCVGVALVLRGVALVEAGLETSLQDASVATSQVATSSNYKSRRGRLLSSSKAYLRR
jgi:hypothetical protein